MDIKKDSQTPFLYENKESNTMVIFVHGILEGPKQFRKFTEVVYNKGFSYSAILLDGHGGSGKKFANSSMKKWINSVEKEILKYKDKYENIILVGHSMGGLLSILLSLKYKNKVKSLILISTPLKVHVRFDMMISSIKIALGTNKKAQTRRSQERCHKGMRSPHPHRSKRTHTADFTKPCKHHGGTRESFSGCLKPRQLADEPLLQNGRPKIP